jgi:tetratricopeptide (TPR) repeat protein
VGLWAEDAAAGRTALAFFQAAEDANPDNPHFPYNVGRIARKLAMYDEAEAWLKWSNWVARGAGRWDVAALSLSGLGNLHRQRGNLPLAIRYHELTRRIARKHGLRTLEGDALYDLVGLSFDFDDPKRGMEYAHRAIQAYGPGHTRIIRLAKDIAWIWMDRYGEFECAAEVFTALLDHIWEPRRRLVLLASLARAAAGAGWGEVFENMWIETWTLLRYQQTQDGHAAALTQVALAAGTLSQWHRARLAASEALNVARARSEGEMVILAESILETVRTNVLAEDGIRAVFRDRGFAPRSSHDQAVAELASDFSAAMRVRRDNAPYGPARTPIRVV